jgi:hypothetical protein
MQDHTDDTTHRDAEPDPCPSWCGRDHRPGLHPDDQHHVSPPRRVVLVTGNPTLEPDDEAVGGAVVARLVRRTRSDQTWLEVVSEEDRDLRLVATLGSVRRLLAVLHDLVSAAD